MAQAAERIGDWPNRGEFAGDWNMSTRQITRGRTLTSQALGIPANGPQLAALEAPAPLAAA